MQGALLWFIRPALRVNLLHYNWDVSRAIFPRDAASEGAIAGPRPSRVLFVGDVAVAGYGVLERGMTVGAQVAALMSDSQQSGCNWQEVARPDLTAARAAAMPEISRERFDIAILMLGVPDVLLATSPQNWAADLEALVHRIRTRSGSHCPIIFAGIPPMADFRPIAPVARRLLTSQINRLDRATLALSARLPHTAFIPFPRWRVGEMYVQETFSWRALHQMWASVLAPAAGALMATSPEHDELPPPPGRTVDAGDFTGMPLG